TPTASNQLTVKSQTISTDLAIGDELRIGDSGSSVGRTYDISATQVIRDTQPTIDHSGIESFEIRTGGFADIVNVASTPADSGTIINTGAGEDEVSIATTGTGSFLEVDTSTDNDLVEVTTTGLMSLTLIRTRAGEDDAVVTDTGALSGLSVNMGSDADVFTLVDSGQQALVEWVGASGEDIANVRGTGAQSATDVRAGTGNDTINVSSSADGTRLDPDAGLNGSLDGLLGELCVHGNENEALPDVSESVTALGNTVTATVSVGDVLNVSDLGSGTSHEYTLDTATFSRVGTPAITFNAIESLIIETGNQLDELTVLRTRAETRSVINTNAGVDSVVIQTTGDNGIVDVDAGTEFDLISIDSTGQESVTLITSRAGEDEILIDGTGTLSGLFVNSGTDSDLVTISGTGDQSVVDVGTAAGEDVINVQATGVSSTTEVNSGTENDAINVSSAANGSLIAPVASAPGTLDQLLGDLLVHGSGDLSNPLIADQVTADGNTFNLQTELGDQLTISDRSLAGGAEYSISTNALTRTGSPAIDFQAIETLFFESGNGNDVVTVIDTRLRTRTTIETNGGEDRVAIEDTGLESVAIVDSGLGNDEISVNGSGNSSLLRLVTRAGDDDVTINSTGDLGGLDVNTGTEVDLVTVIDTGLQTTSLLRLGDQSDVLNVQQVAAASFFEAVGSGGDDVFNLSSDAMGNRSSPVPTLLDDLSGIQSDVLIRGNTNFTNPTTESLDVKGTVVEVTVDTGDLLNISDAGNVAGDQYTLTTTSLQRIGSPEIEFQSMETVQVVTGSGDDDFTLEDTRQQTTTSIDTGAGMDTVLVQTTGNESVTQITMGAGNDVATITTTGDASLLSLNTGTDEDDVIVQSTGTASGLELLTDAGSDVVTIQSNGAESVQSIDLGAETDVLNIRSTSALSALDARLGDGDDFANVTSTANGDRMNRVGDLSGDLAAIAGAICIAGEDDLDGITTDLTVSARRTDADIASVNTVVDLGDSVSISDRGNPAGDDYTLNSNSLARVSQPGGTIIFETIESIGLQTTDFADLIEVESTPSEVLLVIDSGMGEDDVNILATGASSLTRVTTAEDNDVVSVEGTGPQSIVEVFTEVGEDSVSLASLDDESGVLIDTGSDSDVIELLQETSPTARPNGSVIAVQAGSASDTFSVEEVFLNTVVDLMGETENDTFDLTADAADAAGYLGRLNNDPGGVDDGVAATRQLFIDGGANSPGIVSLSQGVSLSGGMNPVPVEPAPVPVEIGDQVNIDASSSALPLDIRYVITGASEGVLVTTTPGDPRQTTGNEVFETIAIEEINIVSGSADDLFTISSNVPYEATSAGQRISFDASGGVDKLEIVGTDDADLISVGPITDADREPIEMENVEFLRIDGDDGNDQIVNRTNAISVIDSLDGDDIVLGGTGPDLLTGGDGVDSLFGRDGNDVLFTDQVLGSNSPTIDDGEIIDGGNEDSIPPGDTCIQFGLDSIRNCEIVGDGGGIKDVLTWLRGVFIDPTDITFVPVSPVLDPFVPAFPTPAETLAVTEPSKLPFSVSSLSAPLSSLLDSNSLKSSKEVKRTSWLTSAIESFGADPMDANRDGIISPRDALFVINSIRQDTTGMDSDARMRLLAGIADVNRDDLVSPRDALMVINYLGRQAEGEGLPQQESDAAWFAAKPIDQVMSGLSRSEDEE
ncbi:MAG: dockerin type I domain-containing protein, partial [Planctomycetota bacterium]